MICYLSELLKNGWAECVVLACLSISGPCLAQRVVLSTDQTRFLYARLENKVSVAVPGFECGDLLLESANCTIEGEGCSYIVIPADVKNAVLMVRSKKSHTIVDSVKIPVVRMNGLKVKIAAGPDNTGSLIEDGPIIEGLAGDCSIVADRFFRLKGFSVSIGRGRDIWYQGDTKGSHFTAEMLAAFKKAQPGDKLYFENVKVIGPDNRERSMCSITYVFN